MLNPCVTNFWQNFRGGEYLCKLGKEYLNYLLCKFVIYSSQYSETFDVSHVFLPLNIAELLTLKQVRFFGPPCIFCVVLKHRLLNKALHFVLF